MCYVGQEEACRRHAKLSRDSLLMIWTIFHARCSAWAEDEFTVSPYGSRGHAHKVLKQEAKLEVVRWIFSRKGTKAWSSLFSAPLWSCSQCKWNQVKKYVVEGFACSTLCMLLYGYYAIILILTEKNKLSSIQVQSFFKKGYKQNLTKKQWNYLKRQINISI